MNIEQARFNMIEQQIRTWEVLDPTVLDLLQQVPREDFVPGGYKGLAFADLEIPLGHGQTMLSPKLEARMLQALDLKKADSVLEIGTGSGYMTALLAKLAGRVDSVEIVSHLSRDAAQKLAAHGIANAALEVGDGARGWGNATYDVIVLTGSTPLLPESFQRQLNPGGRLLAVVGEAPAMEAVLINCVAPGVYRRTTLFETCIPVLRNALEPERFSF
ncbi:MAG TPA: protein-L-isoaspartate O-methyltransferase [Novimethylophilus sp.]|jgi:protein-L-isoaspartate(D-aspartate) O-methyltransferase|uniref:protein-L-isoaspartate O-methyltransferase family protein n=1 Tax=Novimethylophilus sp. TaxID=2137426 RepID=UPI002F3FD577